MRLPWALASPHLLLCMLAYVADAHLTLPRRTDLCVALQEVPHHVALMLRTLLMARRAVCTVVPLELDNLRAHHQEQLMQPGLTWARGVAMASMSDVPGQVRRGMRFFVCWCLASVSPHPRIPRPFHTHPSSPDTSICRPSST